jgi:ATP-binding cassette subfamily B protein
VWFAYQGEQWVLRDASFRIESGQSVAVVGHTGAGKTTLINLLLRFYEPQKGAIRLGGGDIRQFARESLRRRFGAMLQDTHVREGTILDNIRLGLEEISEDAVLEASQRVSLLESIRGLPDGLETQVIERGDNLSTGQKQLIGFARALTHDPKLLILDEATSSVDMESEGRIQRAMGALVEGRTSIIIAHRLSTVLHADRILVMHKGQVREFGTHAELMALKGIYWRLHQLQFRPDEVTEGAAV